MVLTFKYKEILRSNKTRALSPSIPVTFFGKVTKYEFMALLDSGADVSAIPKNMAELLGLDLKGKKEKAFGIGGEVPAVQTNVDIEVGKNHGNYSFRIPVKVILDDSDFPPLIGRAVFFDKFDITFKQSNKKIYLKESKKSVY